MDEGRQVTVKCVASGAKPAAEIYWNSEPEMDLSNVREDTKRSVPTDSSDKIKLSTNELEIAAQPRCFEAYEHRCFA